MGHEVSGEVGAGVGAEIEADGEDSAALVVRVWFEGGSATGGGTAPVFRARLISADPAAPEEATVAIVASPEQLLDAVRDWLDRVTAGPARPT